MHKVFSFKKLLALLITVLLVIGCASSGRYGDNSPKVKLRKKFEDKLSSVYGRNYARNIIRYDLLGLSNNHQCIVSDLYLSAYSPEVSHSEYENKITKAEKKLRSFSEGEKANNIYAKLKLISSYYNFQHAKLGIKSTNAKPKKRDITKMLKYSINLQAKMRYIPVITPASKHIITSRFGNRFNPYSRKYAFHSGIDLINPNGYILAAAAGKVIFAGKQGGYGNIVKINHGNNIHTYYAHLDQIFVKNGSLVGLGQVIAIMGSTGHSTGKHLHYEVRTNNIAIDPISFIGKNCSN